MLALRGRPAPGVGGAAAGVLRATGQPALVLQTYAYFYNHMPTFDVVAATVTAQRAAVASPTGAQPLQVLCGAGRVPPVHAPLGAEESVVRLCGGDEWRASGDARGSAQEGAKRPGACNGGLG